MRICKNIMVSIFTGMILVFGLSSCSNQIIFEEMQEIPDYSWNYKKKFHFKFDIKDTNAVYNIYFHLRHGGNYGNSNIWVRRTVKTPNKARHPYRYEFTLATPEGRWTGKGLGDIIDHQFILDERIRFHQNGTYTYTFNHEMRIDELKEIRSIGLKVVKVSEPD